MATQKHHGRAVGNTRRAATTHALFQVAGPGIPQGSASPQQRPLSRVSPGGFPAVSPPPPAESPIRGHPARGGAEPEPGFLASGDDAWADAPTVEVLSPCSHRFPRKCVMTANVAGDIVRKASAASKRVCESLYLLHVQGWGRQARIRCA